MWYFQSYMQDTLLDERVTFIHKINIDFIHNTII